MNTWIWYLLVYSFLGYLLEVAYAKIVHGRGSGRQVPAAAALMPGVRGGGVAIVALQRSQSSALVGDGGGLRGGHGGGAAVWTLL